MEHGIMSTPITNELQATATRMVAAYERDDDYEGEVYVPIDTYRSVQHDRALAEQALVETLMEVEALVQRKRECKMWRTAFAGLALAAMLAHCWGFI